MESLIDEYVRDPRHLSWFNTVRIGAKLPAELYHPFHSVDLVASLLQRLYRVHGEPFLFSVWRRVGACSHRQTTQEGVDHFILACSQAAGVNLSSVFEYWRWPLSDPMQHQLKTLPDPPSLEPYCQVPPTRFSLSGLCFALKQWIRKNSKDSLHPS